MRTPAVAAPGADLAPPARSLPRPLIGALVAGGIALTALALPALLAGGMGLVLEGRVMPAVRVAEVDVGLLTAAEAEARLRARLPDLAIGELVITLDGSPTAVSFDSLGRDHDFGALVAAAMAVGRSGNPWADGQARLATLLLGTDLPDAVRVDPGRFDRLVVDTATRAFARPQDAAVVITPDGTYSVTPPAAGRRLHPDEIRTALEAVLLVPRSGDLAVELTSEPVPFTVTQRQAAEAAAAARAMIAAPLPLTDGETAHYLAAVDLQTAIGFGPLGDAPYGVQLQEATLAALVSGLADAVRREPTNASFTFGSAGPTGVTPAVPGRSLDVGGTVQAVVDALRDRAAGQEAASATISASFVEPAFSTADAQAVLPNLVRLSTWTTYYVPGDGNGWGANISIPARDLDEMVILPGETFDFWRDIGPVTAERGYTYGGAIIGGRSTAGVALAGGICSTSTTLFNTALRAGLQMGARWNHYYYIPRYPVGLDATVFASDHFTQTMGFTNDTQGPLIIRSYTGSGMVRFDLWGLPLNRTITFSTPVITNRRTALDTIEYTSALPTGTSKRVEYPHHGFDVTVTRTVRDAASGEVIWVNTYFSSYRAVNGVTLVGTG